MRLSSTQLPQNTQITSFWKFLKPFVSSRFWRLNAKTVQMKWLSKGWGQCSYTEYLRQYYCRDLNPYYEAIEDKWAAIRPLIVEMAELGPEEQVLDLCTGLGFQAAALAATDRHVVGIDYVYDRVQLAKQRQGVTLLHWAVADAAHLPLGEDAFDAITISLALHDMPILVIRAVLSEVRRVARRRVVIAEPRMPDHWLLREVYKSVLVLFDESLFIEEYLDANIEKLFQDASLRLVSRKSCVHKMLAVYACDVMR